MDATPDPAPDPAKPPAATERRWLLALAAVLIVQAWFGTTLYRHEANWFFAPDDHEAYVFTHQVARTGVPVWEPTLDVNSSFPVHMPRGSVFVNGHVTTHRGVGMFYAAAPLAWADDARLVFLAPALYGLVATVLLYAVARELAGPGVGVAAAALFGWSAPVLFWSNFLFSNVVALPFFLGAALLLVKGERAAPGRALALRTGALVAFWLAGWIRAEYWLFGAMFVAAFALFGRGWTGPRSAPVLVGCAAILGGAVLAGMYGLYGELTLLASADPDSLSAAKSPAAGQTLFDLFAGIRARRIVSSAENFGFSVSPVFAAGLLAAGLVAAGALEMRRSRRMEAPLVVAIAAVVIFSFTFFGGRIYNRGDGFPLASSYVRYFLPTLALLSLTAALLLAGLARSGGAGRKALAIVVAAALVAPTVPLLADATSGLGAMEKRLERHRAVDAEASRLPESSVIVGDYPNRMILARPVLSPGFIPEKERGPELVRILGDLHAEGRPVYLAKAWARSDHSGDVLRMIEGHSSIRSKEEGAFVRLLFPTPSGEGARG